jgi:SAM-dependent methyltransferase
MNINKYNNIAPIYNEFNVDFWGSKHQFLDVVFKSNSTKKVTLDLGCGTGNLLDYYEKFISNYVGVDHSVEMLRIASNQYPNSHFINDNICTYFNNDIKFDVITSLFDTINHLLDKKHWELLFKNVSLMLKDNGLFVFDICTVKDLVENWPDHLNIIDNHESLIISKGEYNIESKISKIHHIHFNKNNDDNLYIRKDDSIEHISFDIDEIISMLNIVGFNNIEILDLDTNTPINNNTNVAVFLCKKL